MKNSIYIYLLLLILVLPGCTPNNENPLDKYNRGQMLTDIYDNSILPLHQQFTVETNELDSVTQVFATTPNLQNLVVVQEQWKAAQAIWQVCEPVNVGDVRESFIHNTICKWPTNTVFIESFIANSQVLDEAFIEGSGSTSKGFPAMEYLVFGTDNNTVLQQLTTGTNADRRMQYLKALAANLKTKSTQLETMWANYKSTFISETGLAIDGTVSLMVNALLEYEEFIKNDKVGAPLGKKTGGTAQPTSVESKLSHTSMQHIVKNLEGIDALMKGTIQSGNGNGLYTYLDAVDPMEDGTKLSDKIKGQLTACTNAANDITTPLEDAVVNNPAKVDALYVELKKLTVLLKVDMTSILGVTVTFTDNDGD